MNKGLIPRVLLKVNLLQSMIHLERLLVKYFIELLGYQVNCRVVNQDNQCAPCRRMVKSSESANVSYQHSLLFMTYLVKSGELDICYCPTEEMLTDRFTKPVEMNEFYCFVFKLGAWILVSLCWCSLESSSICQLQFIGVRWGSVCARSKTHTSPNHW